MGKSTTTVTPLPNGSKLAIYFWCSLLSFGVTSILFAVTTLPSNAGHHTQSRHYIALQRSKISLWERKKRKVPTETGSQEHPLPSPLAGLFCSDHGGPDDKLAQEMVYWEDIPKDNQHVSPFYAPQRYLTFEPDSGGFNNIRMGMETVLALAYAMGRTLVLPPAQQFYLLTKEHQGEKPKFSFNHFFDMPAIHAEHSGIDIISTEEFMQRVINHEHDTNPLKVLPNTLKTNWDGDSQAWFRHLRKHTKNVIWDPEKCIAYFPAHPAHDAQAIDQQYRAMMQRKDAPKFENFVGKPTPFDAPEMERLAEFAAERRQLCLYSPELQEEPILHFPHENANRTHDWDPRLLVHFYAFLFFADIHQDLWTKRFVRDHVRYTDEIQCAAARVVAAMREKARHHHPHITAGTFHSMHVRRGDFQYKITRVPATAILTMVKRQFQDGDVVYIATDQRNKSFFDPLQKHYHLYYLDDFIEDGTVGKSVNSNYYGMIDQLVASRGKIFFGCWFSTFTGYINRLRGYHSQRQKEPGYEEGKVMTSFFYAPSDRYDFMTTYYPVKKSFYAREFPAGWRLLNWDLNQSSWPSTKKSVERR